MNCLMTCRQLLLITQLIKIIIKLIVLRLTFKFR